MSNTDHFRRTVSTLSAFLTLASLKTNVDKISIKTVKRILATSTTVLFTLTCMARAQSQTSQEPDPQPSQLQAKNNIATVTIPAGTHLILVLTHPIQSRYIHHGDAIYAQINSPVNSGNQMVIPPGTLVQGQVDKLQQHDGRADLRLQSMSITFPDGYVAPVSGPITIESSQGYAIKDPGSRRTIGAFALPAAGAGLGALIGHSAGTAQSQVTTTSPPGCIGGPPFCSTSTQTVAGTKGRDAIIGAGIGSAIGAVASLTLLFSSHHFFLDVGSPVEMTLQQPISLQQSEIDRAAQQSGQHPFPRQAIAPRPTPYYNGTCYSPGTPGTPSTTIPGAPGPDGIPGPPTIIPGTPPTPGMPYPCP